jgi:Holliday junction resolvasome RuvABC endonuclease subunit
MVLGIDPGPTASGWALLDFTIASSPVWFEGGNTEHVLALFKLLEQRGLAERIGLVAVEQAVALWKPEANVQAMRTAWAGGRVAGMAEALGFNVAALGVDRWRQAFVGHSEKGENVDHKVAAALRMFVRHFPVRSNVHMRDAAGVACVAARDWRRRVVPSVRAG